MYLQSVARAGFEVSSLFVLRRHRIFGVEAAYHQVCESPHKAHLRHYTVHEMRDMLILQS